MDRFIVWFRRWLNANPLKPPPAHVRKRFTADVMREVRTAAGPRRGRVLAWPLGRSLAWTAAAAAALLVLVFAGGKLRRRAAVHTAEAGAIAEIRLLAALDQDLLAAQGSTDPIVGEDLVLAERLVVTEQVADVAAGLEKLIRLFEALEEPAPVLDSESYDDAEWLRELNLLEQLGRRS